MILPSLQIYLFGPLRMELNGAAVVSRRRKAQALLAYLAVTGQPHSRDALATLLWPEFSQSQARANLRRELAELRGLLGVARLLDDRVTVALNTEPPFGLDLANFQQHLAYAQQCTHLGYAPGTDVCPACLPHLSQAAACYPDDFLAGFTLPDSPTFDDWHFFQADGLRQTLAHLLARLVQGHHAAQHYAEAIPHARRWVALDPLHEPAHCALMMAYEMAGQHAAALRQYESCVRVLAEELGVPPAAATTAVYEQLRRRSGNDSELTSRLLPAVRKAVAGAAEAPPFALEEPVWHAAPSAGLPTQVSSFIGRTQEMARVQQLLRRDDVRLVTLTGPPGIGKTRLALQVLNRVHPQYRNGVAYINLIPLADPSLVATTIALALAINENAGQPILETLGQVLADQEKLLLLDNFEQIVTAAPIITTLLAAAPGLKVLVTSQVLLDLHGEHVFTVPALTQPDRQTLPSAGSVLTTKVAEYEAVQLFVQRAQARKADFALTEQNALVVSQICRRLDGLPLAIELAAARIAHFPLSAMLEALHSSRFTPLTRAPQDTPARHRTLRAAIDWSYELLDNVEQKLLRRLSVFVGGFTPAAAAAVCKMDGEDAVAMIDGITALINKSLLWQAETATGNARYWQLPTIREYGLERLRESGEHVVVAQQHAYFFLHLAEEGWQKFTGAEESAWLKQLTIERDNLRAALDWDEGQEVEGEFLLRLAGALGPFWEIYGHVREGRDYLARSLAQSASATKMTEHKARALNSAGNLADLQGDVVAARTYYQESLTIRRLLKDKSGVAVSLNNLGRILFVQGDINAAYPLYAESLALRRELGNKGGIAMSLNDLGEVARHRKDYAQAAQLYCECLALFREIGNDRGVGWALHNLGYVNRYGGAEQQATSCFGESLALFNRLGYTMGQAACLIGMASSWVEHGKIEKALELMIAAKIIHKSIDAQMWPADRAEYDQILILIQKSLGQTTFEAKWLSAQAMTTEQAIALAINLGSLHA